MNSGILNRIIRIVRYRKTGLQHGFTLIELLIGVFISGLLAVGISMGISQLITINASSNTRMVAIKQVENAIDYMRQDVIMSQDVTPTTSGETGFPLTLSWIEWDNTKNVITYELNGSNELIRKESINDGEPVSRAIAKNISSISMLDPETYSGGKISFSITATVGGYKASSETRTFEVLPRPAN